MSKQLKNNNGVLLHQTEKPENMLFGDNDTQSLREQRDKKYLDNNLNETKNKNHVKSE